MYLSFAGKISEKGNLEVWSGVAKKMGMCVAPMGTT